MNGRILWRRCLLPAIPILLIGSILKAQSAADQNQRAQTEYYQEQVKKLQREGSSPWPSGTSVATVVSVLTALTAVATLCINAWYTRRQQMDTQFYEALKRFGDPESPALRASAAGLLEQMADRQTKRAPAIVAQLITGMALETDPVALLSTCDAVVKASKSNSRYAVDRLDELLPHLEKAVAQAMIDLFYSCGGTVSPAGGKEMPQPERQRYEALCKRGEQITRLKKAELESLVDRFFHTAKADSASFVASIAEPSTDRATREQVLIIAVLRLRMNWEAADQIDGGVRTKDRFECYQVRFGNTPLQASPQEPPKTGSQS